jgi:hypothetical protein
MALRAGAAMAAALAAPALAQQGHVVTVDVSGVRSDAGTVRANLCDNETMFCATYQASAAASTDGAELIFAGVAPGRYALVAFHDENGDGQAQIPPEGYAYGNGAGYPPAFDAASILVEGDAQARLDMTYIAGAAAMGLAPAGSTGAPAPDGVAKVDVRENGLYGAFYRPQTQDRVPAIILLGGSEGGIDTISAMATSFAQAGYGALALAYWGEVGLPQTLEAIPLEYFDAAVDWLQGRPGVQADSIGVMGWSRGSEAALLLGARNPAIKAVGAIAPSGIVWSGLDFADFVNVEAAWTADGAPLPFMTTDAALYVPGGAMTPMFEAAIAQADARPETEIPVERINGPVLLISGGDDALWPSATFAQRIQDRLKDAAFPHAVESLVYPEAGHVVFVGAPDGMMARTMGSMQNPMMGGSLEADAAAWADNWPRTLAFFEAALKEGGQ